MGNSESSNEKFVSKKNKDPAKKKKRVPKEDTNEIVHQVVDGKLQDIVNEFNVFKAAMDEKKEAKQRELSEEEILAQLPFAQKVQFLAKNSIEKNSPGDDKMKGKITFVGTVLLWFLSRAAMLALLVYFTAVSYIADQSTRYLSLDNAAQDTGSSGSNYRTCLSVPFAVTGSWVLDVNGYWTGMTAFIDGRGIYKFTFSNFEKSNSLYTAYMADVKSRLSTVANSSKSNTIMRNIVLSSSWIYNVYDGDYTHSVSLTGDPAYIFNRFYKGAVVGNYNLRCYAIPEITYDVNSGSVLVRFLYGSYTTYKSSSCVIFSAGSGFLGGSGTYSYSSPSPSPGPGPSPLVTTTTICPTSVEPAVGCCPSFANTSTASSSLCVIVPSDAGYSSEYDKQYFTLRYNIRSLVTAYAVNNGILPISSLSNVVSDLESSFVGCYSLYGDDCLAAAAKSNKTCSSSKVGLAYSSSTSRCSIKQGGVRYNIRSYMDLRYSDMDPIYCLIDSKQNDTSTGIASLVCMVRVGNVFAYPFLSHMGVSTVKDFYNWGYGCYCSKPSFPSSYKTFYDSTFYASSNGKYYGQSESYCNSFDLMHGLIIFKGQNYDSHLFLNAVMAKLYSAEELNNMAYFSGFLIIRTSGNAGSQDLATKGGTQAKVLIDKLMSPGGATNANSFCSFTSGFSDDQGQTTSSCSVFAMQTYDEFDKRINVNGAAIPLGSCSDFITIPNTAWDNGSGGGALNIPPTHLVQVYYQCYSTQFNSMVTAFGSASGTAGFLTPIFVTMMVFFVFRMFQKRSEAEASNEANEEICTIKIEMKNENGVGFEENQDPLLHLNLPSGWSAFTEDSSGDTYYHNPGTGETRWDAPPKE